MEIEGRILYQAKVSNSSLDHDININSFANFDIFRNGSKGNVLYYVLRGLNVYFYIQDIIDNVLLDNVLQNVREGLPYIDALKEIYSLFYGTTHASTNLNVTVFGTCEGNEEKVTGMASELIQVDSEVRMVARIRLTVRFVFLVSKADDDAVDTFQMDRFSLAIYLYGRHIYGKGIHRYCRTSPKISSQVNRPDRKKSR